MNDSISRQAAVDLVTDMEFMNNTAKGILRDRLRKLSPAQPERKKGKWINLKNKKGTILALRCSVCGNSPKHAIRSDFCPNCGAEMRGEENGKNK